MYVRFSVPVSTSISSLDFILRALGNPKLIYHNMYFYGDISQEYISQVIEFKDEEILSGLWWVHLSDDLPVGFSENGT